MNSTRPPDNPSTQPPMSLGERLGRHIDGVQARYDALALRPPAPAPDEEQRLKAHAGAVRSVLAWCHQDAVPRTRRRLTVAALRGTVGTDGAAVVAWAEAFGRHIDGGIRLDAMPSAQGAAWRLKIKLAELVPLRARRPGDPWDAGWAVSTPLGLRQLQIGWRPRRATLVLADAADQAALRIALAALWQRRNDFGHPVRWLWVGGAVDLPAVPGQTVEHIRLGVPG